MQYVATDADGETDGGCPGVATDDDAVRLMQGVATEAEMVRLMAAAWCRGGDHPGAVDA